MTLVSIQTPVAPVQIVLLEQSHYVVPGNILLVVTKLAHEEGDAVVQAADVQLVVK